MKLNNLLKKIIVGGALVTSLSGCQLFKPQGNSSSNYSSNPVERHSQASNNIYQLANSICDQSYINNESYHCSQQECTSFNRYYDQYRGWTYNCDEKYPNEVRFYWNDVAKIEKYQKYIQNVGEVPYIRIFLKDGSSQDQFAKDDRYGQLNNLYVAMQNFLNSR